MLQYLITVGKTLKYSSFPLMTAILISETEVYISVTVAVLSID